MKIHQPQQRSVQRQVSADQHHYPHRTDTDGFSFEDKRPETLQMKMLREIADRYAHAEHTVQANHGAFNEIVQRIRKEALVLHKSYKYDGKTLLYFGVKGGKHIFKTSESSAMSTRLTDEQLNDVTEISPGEQPSEKIEPKKDIGDVGGIIVSTGTSEPKQNQIAPKSIHEARPKAEQDTGGWFVEPAVGLEKKIAFLNTVIARARLIIPKAFNRKEELTPGIVDFTNTATRCKDKLIGLYARHLGEAGVAVHNNYIHPAALERIYQIVTDTAPAPAREEGFSITGVCKDFASICYGLILQNDVTNKYSPQLAFMSGHVYVKVTIDNIVYAIDAWLNGPVVPQQIHEKAVSQKHKGILSYDPETYTRIQLGEFEKSKSTDEVVDVQKFKMETDTDKKRRTGEQTLFNESLKEAYKNAERARLIWYQNEELYVQLAKDEWESGKTEHVNRGKE